MSMVMLSDLTRTYAREDLRACKKCQRVLPIEVFPVYRAKGGVGHRHQCRDCVRLYRKRWEANLAPEQAEQYYARKRVKNARWKRAELRQQYRERRLVLKAIVSALIAQGMTQAEVAHRANLHEKTVQRIMRGTDGRVRFHEPTEAGIVNVYLDVKGREAA